MSDSMMSCVRWLALGAIVVLSGCSSGDTGVETPAAAAGATYATPDEGVEALVKALRANDQELLHEILGAEADQILSSGDPAEDAEMRERFLTAYDAKHALEPSEDGKSTTLVIGEDWPMPIPLVQADGAWRFDVAAGKEEILARRIGRNEMSVIDTCDAIVDAQREYAELNAEKGGQGAYAERFISSQGKKDGLYWETAEGQPPSPLGPLVGQAVTEGTVKAGAPYNGYYYRMLTGQGDNAPGGARSYMDKGRMTGGFAVVAWPAEWGNSGVMTFLVSTNGVVYQKDLGAGTDAAARAMTTFDPGEGWTIVQ